MEFMLEAVSVVLNLVFLVFLMHGCQSAGKLEISFKSKESLLIFFKTKNQIF
jgi:hypothetical protein